MKHCFFILMLVFATPVKAEEAKRPDTNWNYATGLKRRHIGVNETSLPQNVDPYLLEKSASAKELHPSYEFNSKDLQPVSTQTLEGLRQSVTVLKDNIFQSKARVFELVEQDQQRKRRDISSSVEKQFAEVKLTHLDRLSEQYQLISLTYYLNGQKIYSLQRDFERAPTSLTKPSFKVFDGMLLPGKYTVTVHAIFQGNGEGLFKYLNDYRVRIVDEKEFTTFAGEHYAMTMTAFEKGRFYTGFRDRPIFQLDVVKK